MELYHITWSSNVANIFREGIRPSLGGADGPGVYAWIGDLKDVLRNADCMMFDGTTLTEEEQIEKMHKFTVLRIELPFSMDAPDVFDRWLNTWWEDYVVLRDGVPPEYIVEVGNFGDLCLKYSSTGGIDHQNTNSLIKPLRLE